MLIFSTATGAESVGESAGEWSAFVRSQAGDGRVLVDDRFDDEGYSATTLDRPARNRLLGVVRSGGLDRLVVYRLDRLSRNLRHFVNLSEEFRGQRVALAIVTAPMLGVAALDHMMLNVMASSAEFERDMTASRIAEARACLKGNGRRVAGAVPFGYAADSRTKQLVVAPEVEGGGDRPPLGTSTGRFQSRHGPDRDPVPAVRQRSQ
jgi:site-specific DNA recombinase